MKAEPGSLKSHASPAAVCTPLSLFVAVSSSPPCKLAPSGVPRLFSPLGGGGGHSELSRGSVRVSEGRAAVEDVKLHIAPQHRLRSERVNSDFLHCF